MQTDICLTCGLVEPVPTTANGIVCPHCGKALRSTSFAGREPGSMGSQNSAQLSEGCVANGPWLGSEPIPASFFTDPLGGSDPEVAKEWLRHEIIRFNTFVEERMATLGQLRHSLERAEVSLVRREQVLTRKEAQIRAREAVAAAAKTEATVWIERRNELGFEIATLERKAQELRPLGTEQEWQRIAAADRVSLLRRAAALEKSERELEVRLMEVEDLENRLRDEFEERERSLKNERSLIEEELDEARIGATTHRLLGLGGVLDVEE